MTTVYGLDFETYGEVDLPKYGLDNYVSHSSFRPLVASLAWVRDNGAIAMQSFDFLNNPDDVELFAQTIENADVVAHNASFERAVLKHMGLAMHPHRIYDSAVIARGVGASSSLESAGPQLRGTSKVASGTRLIQKFSMPRKDGAALIDDTSAWSDEDWDDWQEFIIYCNHDAVLSVDIFTKYSQDFTYEWGRELITQSMNEVGWKVDTELVRSMSSEYQKNLVEIEARFREKYDPKGELNFRSTQQLRKWCKERGVNATSFDEMHVSKMLEAVKKRMLKGQPNADLLAVYDLLRTKQELGGSSLSKLEKILELVGEDDILRNQYMHVGAGQTFRTSGRGVQMQNLKRIGGDPGDVDGGVVGWSNDELARNLRQVFTSKHPDGQLIVGDFSSVESRGLAYLAGAQWKLDNFYNLRDMYKVLASSMLGISYESVGPAERQLGKVGELSCGYGAGGGAVSRFAEKMGSPMSEKDATALVRDWRAVNVEIVEFWAKLDDLLQQVVTQGKARAETKVGPGGSMALVLSRESTPWSIQDIRKDAVTVAMTLYSTASRYSTPILKRWFQGCFTVGSDICYMKASDLKSGALWYDRWFKNGESGRYKLYGGKLTGILVQSFCREIFFDAADEVENLLMSSDGMDLVGQFHDELVVDWRPTATGLSLADAKEQLRAHMTKSPGFPGFPLAVEVKSSYRYTK